MFPCRVLPFAEANLRRLIAMTRDADRTNRDWATFLLSQSDIDTPEVRDTLVQAAGGDDAATRAEAIWGLARRDQDMALPLVQAALAGECVSTPILEAAALLARPSLIDNLRRWAKPSGDAYLDKVAA